MLPSDVDVVNRVWMIHFEHGKHPSLSYGVTWGNEERGS